MYGKVVILASLLGLCACSNNVVKDVATSKYECHKVFALPEGRPESFDCDSLTVSIDLQLPVGANWQEARNMIISSVIPDKTVPASDTAAIPEKISALRSDYVTEFKEFVSDYPEDYRPFEYYYSYEGKFQSRYENIVMYLLKSENYTGGAHGMYTAEYLNFDRATGKRLLLADVLPDVPKERIQHAALAYLREVEGFDESFIMYDPSVVYTENVIYSGDGVTFVYQPYEVACYAVGIVEVTVPWFSLRPEEQQ